MASERMARSAGVGVCVGLTDVAFVYPLAVLATRRENGMPFRTAIAARSFHAGGLTAATLLLPYSMLVEGLSTELRSVTAGFGSASPFVAASLTAVVAALGTQPVEKKMVMDQMLERRGKGRAGPGASRRSSGSLLLQPARDIAAYSRAHGLRALYSGFFPLLAREASYIIAITAVTPLVSRQAQQWTFGDGSNSSPSAGDGTNRDSSAAVAAYVRGAVASFLVGTAAGVFSAPFQTLNAMMKSEVNRGRNLPSLLTDMFARGRVAGVQRLYFGAATRSLRTGFACVLYHSYRTLLQKQPPA
eukprot:m.118985 g.118985  ORF g.118985 m.118985 type:complete len:302 (-) comp16449_c1_seq1:128-1033(-)